MWRMYQVRVETARPCMSRCSMAYVPVAATRRLAGVSLILIMKMTLMPARFLLPYGEATPGFAVSVQKRKQSLYQLLLVPTLETARVTMLWAMTQPWMLAMTKLMTLYQARFATRTVFTLGGLYCFRLGHRLHLPSLFTVQHYLATPHPFVLGPVPPTQAPRRTVLRPHHVEYVNCWRISRKYVASNGHLMRNSLLQVETTISYWYGMFPRQGVRVNTV
mmetsp:Transcript_14179/g.23475  ORF Transcript_14179/g.23475 Transcript_14179/m.23475 type:complete len:219 (+) Transcript_14179:1213-1869(+)